MDTIMEEEQYRLTPLGLFSTKMTYEQARALENVIIEFLEKAGEKARARNRADPAGGGEQAGKFSPSLPFADA